MISHIHKCIFVHIPKSAGISIEQIFLDDLDLDFNNRTALLLGINLNTKIGPPRLSHLTSEEYFKLHFISKELFDRYYKFTVVRNPYDRIYSFYKYLGFIHLISFETFVLKYLNKIFNDERFEYFLRPMYDYVYDHEGKLLVDYIAKLENLKNDFSQVAKQLKLENYTLQNLNNSHKISIKTIIIRVLRLIRTYPKLIFDITILNRKKTKQMSEQMRNVVVLHYSKDFRAFSYNQ